MLVSYSDQFLKSASRLPKKLIAQADTKEVLFKSTPFHSSLETHKLHGYKQDVWAFSVNQKYRIQFIFITSGSVLFLDIGQHDTYR